LLGAQTLERLPDRNFRLTFTDLGGQSHTIVIEAMDRIDPELRVVVTRNDGQWVYDYTIINKDSDEASTGIIFVHLPCPPEEAVAAWVVPEDWSGRVLQREGAWYCKLTWRENPIEPGQERSGFRLESSWMPIIAHADVAGWAEPFVWPTEDIPRAVYELSWSVRDAIGGGRLVAAVVPGRAPNGSVNAATLLNEVTSYLRQACGDLAWISNAGVCHSLEVKLDQAARSLDRGRVDAARGQLGAFLQELEAQHGTQPGKHVSDNAYALLRPNAEYLLSRL
jgi:hypothetical protein